jgi:hypothetical protein
VRVLGQHPQQGDLPERRGGTPSSSSGSASS